MGVELLDWGFGRVILRLCVNMLSPKRNSLLACALTMEPCGQLSIKLLICVLSPLGERIALRDNSMAKWP